HIGNFAQGQTGAQYTITVTNSGSGPTNGTTVTVTDTLPTGLTATAITGVNWTCTLGTLTCTRSDVLAASSSYEDIILTVDVANNAPSSLTNQVNVAGGGEINTANDSATDPTNVTQIPDLTIAKSHIGNFTQGQAGAQYTITVTNNGSGPTDGSTVTVTDTLPTGLTATAISGTNWTCTLGTLTCTRNDALAVGYNYESITVTVDVANNANPSVTNTASVSGGGENNTSNDTANDVTTIGQLPDLTITKTHIGNFAQGQTGAQYTITVTNSGTGPTDGSTVTVADALPTGLTATAISGTGWTCTLGTLTCTRANVLAASSSYPDITLTVNVAGNASSSITNTVSVSGGGENNTSNDTASDVTTVGQVPDLTITKTHSGNFVKGQVGAQYTITVNNVGGAATDGTTVTVTDSLPSGLTATAISGTNWTCVLGTLTCTRTDALAPASSYEDITLTVNVASNASSPLTNTVTVSGGGDAITSDNSASDTTTIDPFLAILNNGVDGQPGNVVITNNGSYTTQFTGLTITFNRDVNDSGGGAGTDDATNPANYLLIQSGTNGAYDTTSCLSGLAGDDVQIPTGPVTYSNNGGSGPFIAMVAVNNGTPLPLGEYRLFVCGTTSITDLAGNPLNGGVDSQVTFTITNQSSSGGRSRQLPVTGFAPNIISSLPVQPEALKYSDLGNLWIEIPSLGVRASITGIPQTNNSWDLTWLYKQVGWLQGTSFPTWSGNSVLTAHVYNSDGTPGLFINLKNLSYDQQIIVHMYGMRYVYAVRINQVLSSYDTNWALKHEDISWLTLLTCEDYDPSSNTYLYRRGVRAVLIKVETDK
ncbi:MAG TPA: sortase, partial [Anaerolineales bacterium]|nr:sortase [Anaerolineales bacterium]